ncbi:MAG: hypothetical protein NT166_05040 [Candidatus Aminicenantes bacterium]|nr:hypothetical protein [Candidatus Aminicenantes bacterium]
MKSITIYGLDDMLDKQIRERAKSQRLSLNKTIKKLLEKSLGITQGIKRGRQEDFMEFFGVWSDDDLREFNKTGSEFKQVDPGDWR